MDAALIHYGSGSGYGSDLARRIVEELAKVKLNGVGWPVQVELADAYEVCRAIAAEGADDGK